MGIHNAGADGEPKRRRTGAEIREALLASARDRFGAVGYDNVSLADIAKAAGVHASVVNRYFGSKEALFRAVLLSAAQHFGASDEERVRLSSGPHELARQLAEIVADPDASQTNLDRVRILGLALRSAGSPVASRIIAEDLDERYTVSLADQLEGPDAAIRASVISAMIMGLSLARYHLRVSSIAACPAEKLVEIITPAFEQLALSAGPASPK